MASNTIVPQPTNKHRIIDANTYKQLCDFINNYCGLPIDCEIELQDKFPQIQRLTLKGILETELLNRTRSDHWHYESNCKKFVAKYTELSKKNPTDTAIILNIARAEKIGPVMVCRGMLKSMYNSHKMMISKMIRYPHLIQDPLLSANVSQCLCSDSQDGPIVDLRRRILGEEYEFKLKRMANEAGMHFYDESDLRRLGYDKTPDIKMLLPFLYKGEIMNWIESKAKFGDIQTHILNVKQQLASYCNRFGSGIVIYWFGYHESTPKLADNSIGITVLDDFPSQSEIELLDLSENTKAVIKKVEEET